MASADQVRALFPILGRSVGGRRLVYLDNAATTQKPLPVLQALTDFYEKHYSNVHRGIHALAEEATAMFEEARRKVARFVNAPSERGVVFTRNCTEAINLVAQAWGRASLREGDEVLLTLMEHHSNIVPWQLVAASTGARLRYAGIDGEGRLDLEDLASKLSARTRMVSLTHVSNVLGTVNPVAEVVRMAREVGALVLVDGAQAVAHLATDFQALGCDFYTFSGHKMFGPSGIGVLVARPELLEEMPPFLGGGEMISDVWLEGATWNEIPWKFEAGTPAIAEAVALGAAVDFLQGIGLERIAAHEEALIAAALSGLEEMEGVRVYGPRSVRDRTAVLSFNIEGVHPHDTGTLLDQEGIAVRAGHHCAKPLMRHLGVPATARASFAIYNTMEDVEDLVRAVEKARKFFTGR